MSNENEELKECPVCKTENPKGSVLSICSNDECKFITRAIHWNSLPRQPKGVEIELELDTFAYDKLLEGDLVSVDKPIDSRFKKKVRILILEGEE